MPAVDGDGDEGQRRRLVRDPAAREPKVRPALGCHEPSGLRRVHGRPAADRDDRVGSGLRQCRGRLLDVVDGGLARPLDEAGVVAETLQGGGHLGNTLYDFVHDDEGPARTLAPEHVRKRRDNALAEADPDRKVVAERVDVLHGHPLSNRRARS